ncbi:MAG: HlyD family secretion protein [Candidatus Sumerlaeota bacterium]|nr:HlyD family secretion protein [Candidatus Sumerlaeota bacterium]
MPALGPSLKLAAKVLIVGLVVGLLVYRLHFMPAEVAVVGVERGDVIEETLGTGTLEAKTRGAVSSKIQGRIARIEVEQNDWVTSGQLLLEIESRDLHQQVEVAEAAVRSAEATVRLISTEEARAQAVLEQAQRDYERMVSLLEQSAVARADVERADEALLIARADITRVQAGIEEGRYKLLEARENLRYQQARLAESRIHAPYDALVVRKNAEAGDIAVPGAQLLEIISPDVLWVSAWVDEAAMGKLREGQAARVVFRSEPSRSFPGRVARWNREVDRETRQFLVDVLVEELPGNWAIGQRAEVFIETDRIANALTIPASVLVWRDGSPEVFLVRDGVAERVPVELGIQGSEAVEVLTGVNSGDLLIQPQRGKSLKEGARVRHESGNS